MLLEIAGQYINPLNITTIKVYEGSLANVSEVVVTLACGTKLRTTFPDRDEARLFLEWVSDYIDFGPEFEEEDDDD